MLHRQRALFALPIWFGSSVLLALSIIYIVQIASLIAFNKLSCQSVLFSTNKKTVQANFQKASRECVSCAQQHSSYDGENRYCFKENLYN